MTSEARAIIAAWGIGLWLKPENYQARSWLILSRWKRRYRSLQPVQSVEPIDRDWLDDRLH